MDMPNGIGQTLPKVLSLISLQELLVLVHMTRNDIEVETLCGLGLAIHEQRKGLRRRVAQPFLDGQAVAL